MISVDEALRQVLAHAQPLTARSVPLADALGLMLAQDVLSDVDSPPHDKSVVDGYAVQAASTFDGAQLEVVEEVTAGQLPTREVTATTATRIMTGAPIPPGADAVIMVERTELIERAGANPLVRLGQQLPAGQNIVRQGTSMRRGQVVLQAGRPLSAIAIGLLAEVGCANVRVVPRPSVAVLATGNELVEPNRTPSPGQIRNSNGPMLAAMARECDAMATQLGIARDEAAHLRDCIDRGLQHDVLVLSGGVSAGVLDLVPSVLSEAGVEQVFHKVHLKPGKPLWFGVRRTAERATLVFGLPGNPVSSLVSFQLFVRPALAALAGKPSSGLMRTRAKLTDNHRQSGDRPTYWPGAWRLNADGASQIEPLRWKGSGDLFTLAASDGLICFPPGTREFLAGEEIDVLSWHGGTA